MRGHWIGVVAVWFAALVGSVLTIAIVAPGDRLQMLVVALAACVFLAFCVQLIVSEVAGFVTRLMLSLAGAFAVLLVASGVVPLLAGTAGTSA